MNTALTDGIKSIKTTLSYELCLAECRADHKCLSLQYHNAIGGKDNCILYGTVPHHIPNEPKDVSDRDWITAVMQCGKNLSFVRFCKYQKKYSNIKTCRYQGLFRLELYCILCYDICLIDPCDVSGESPCHQLAIDTNARGVCEVKNNGNFGCRSK